MQRCKPKCEKIEEQLGGGSVCTECGAIVSEHEIVAQLEFSSNHGLYGQNYKKDSGILYSGGSRPISQESRASRLAKAFRTMDQVASSLNLRENIVGPG